MAAYQVFIGRHVEVEDKLNGYQILGPFPNTGLPLGGKTFKIGATTVTFAGAAGANVTIDAAVAALNAGFTGFARKRGVENAAPANQPSQDGVVRAQVAIVIGDGTSHTIDKTGTANPILGISASVDTVLPAAIAQAKIAGFTLGIYSGHFALIIAP